MAALHPTMNAMIVWYLQLSGVLTAKSTNVDLNDAKVWAKLKDLPEWFYAYGVYYSKDEVKILVHFPAIQEMAPKPVHLRPLAPRQEGPKRKWILVQMEVASYDIKDAQAIESAVMSIQQAFALRTRFQLGIALAAVRRHNEELEKMLGSFANKFRRVPPNTVYVSGGMI